MRNDKHLAFILRKKGLSYNKISKELGISKSTLSEWFSSLSWSRDLKSNLTKRANYIAKKRLRAINQERRERWEKWREGFRKEAKKEFPLLMKNPLFPIGISLYWGEGDSKIENGIVRLSNTSPGMISVYVNFLQSVVCIPREKLRVGLVLYPDLKEEKCKSFWSAVTGIPTSQFYKTQFIYGRHPTKRSENGICMILLRSRGVKEKFLVWQNKLAQMYGYKKTRE